MVHVCHAEACRLPVPPRMFMCRRHWFALPVEYRDAVWSHYVEGQERRKDPTPGYLAVTRAAIEWTARAEGRRDMALSPCTACGRQFSASAWVLVHRNGVCMVCVSRGLWAPTLAQQSPEQLVLL